MRTVDLVRKFRHIFDTNYTADINCQAAWLFTEGSGTSVADSSQNTNTGNFRGAGEPAWAPMAGAGAPSYSDYMVTFDGGNDFINAGHDASLDFTTTDHSFCAWINPDSLGGGGFGRIFDKRTNGNGYMFYIRTNNALRLTHPGAVDPDITSTDNAITFIGTWQHIGGTYDDINDTGIVYVGGVDVTLDGTADAIKAHAAADLLIGNSSPLTRGFDGRMGEGGAFDRGLDSTEMNEIMDNGLVGVVVNPYPTAWLKKKVISGYHCFMNQYMRSKVLGYDPLKLPDGTVW